MSGTNPVKHWRPLMLEPINKPVYTQGFGLPTFKCTTVWIDYKFNVWRTPFFPNSNACILNSSLYVMLIIKIEHVSLFCAMNESGFME